jgi:ATP-dependent Clp protease ATP-binding subunit ClpX
MPALPKEKRTPPLLEAALREFIVGQEHAIRVVSTMIGNAEFADSLPIHRPHMLVPRTLGILGPMGSGKTVLMEKMADLCGSISVHVSATDLAQTGIVGEHLSDWLERAYALAQGNKEKAERAKIYVDEIDKIAKGKDRHIVEVNGVGAQRQLLTALQGKTVYIGKDRNVPFDTRRLIWFFAGAFEGMPLPDDSTTVPREALIKWGLEPQFVDRISQWVRLWPLGKAEYRRLLLDVPTSPIKKLKASFFAAKITLDIQPGTVEALLDLIPEGSSARGVESVVVEHLAMPLLYRLPDWHANGVKRVEVSPECLLDCKPPVVLMPAPDPIPSVSPEIRALREKVKFDEASDDAKEVWRKIEVEYPNAVGNIASAIAVFKSSLEEFVPYVKADRSIGMALDYFLTSQRADAVERKQIAAVKDTIFKSADRCVLTGHYVFRGYVDKNCRDAVPESHVCVQLKEGESFPHVGDKKRAARWQLVRDLSRY